MLIAVMAVRDIFARAGYDTTITSAFDGIHSAGSLHYHGLALDFRTRHIPTRDRDPLARAIKEALGHEFDVVLEPTHLHIEFDPKGD